MNVDSWQAGFINKNLLAGCSQIVFNVSLGIYYLKMKLGIRSTLRTLRLSLRPLRLFFYLEECKDLPRRTQGFKSQTLGIDSLQTANSSPAN